MKRVYVSDLKAGKSAFLQGWIYEIRDLAKLKFLLLRDFSGIVQCVVKNKSIIQKISDLTLESVVEITGKVKKAKVEAELVRKDIEVEVTNLKILNISEKLPMQVNEKAVKANLSTRLNNRSLDLRKPKIKAIFKN